jgi:hypothetical protein
MFTSDLKRVAVHHPILWKAWTMMQISSEKSGLKAFGSVIFSANTKKHDFVAKLAKWLLTEHLHSCKTAGSYTPL